MKIIEPSFKIFKYREGEEIIKSIELYGRTCYKSEDLITDTSAKNFVSMILKRGHESVLEHEKVTVRIICDRGVSHEIVRHRIASYSQESTRYVNYNKKEIQFINPCFWDANNNKEKYELWLNYMECAEDTYCSLINMGAKPEEARSVLPNSLKTEIVCTYNLREWRHFFKLRCAPTAHPQMRQITIPLLKAMKEYIPIIFDDIRCEENK